MSAGRKEHTQQRCKISVVVSRHILRVKMRFIACTLLLLGSVSSYAQQTTTWAPSSQIKCRTNDDCNDLQSVCCSITVALGKRQLTVGDGFYPYVHYCLPYKTTDNPWCDLRLQFSPLTPNYKGLCPCGPGLKCTPTTELDPKYYPRDRYGKCTPT